MKELSVWEQEAQGKLLELEGCHGKLAALFPGSSGGPGAGESRWWGKPRRSQAPRRSRSKTGARRGAGCKLREGGSRAVGGRSRGGPLRVREGHRPEVSVVPAQSSFFMPVLSEVLYLCFAFPSQQSWKKD